jgi:hypothetical protein
MDRHPYPDGEMPFLEGDADPHEGPETTDGGIVSLPPRVPDEAPKAN